MKKGLLSILAGALVLVGCQNYDDQFDSLESQINALASTVAGLSQVQSDLASLAGTVNSLSSTVSGLGSQIDTAVANGLADIQADITAIEAAVADVASSSDVENLQSAVDASQADLDELLAASSVFTGTVTVNSTSTLNAFHAMKSSLAIVNGSVDIDVTADMDIVKVQELVDAILTVTGSFDYAAAVSTITEVTFNNLTGVQSLTLKQAGGYQAQALKSATVITLNDAFESKVTKIDFRELTSVTKFVTGAASSSSTDNKIDFNQATELHLTKLPRYAQNTLTIVIDEGGALPISALDDVDANGDQADLTLDITGPASLTLSKITDGSITLTDVKAVSVTDFTGTLTISSGVETLTVVDGVIVDVTGASDLVTANIDLKLDDDPDLTAAQTAALDYGTNGDLDFTDLTDLTEVTISGQVNDITLSGNTNLETVTISAKADDLTISGATDLTSVTVTGAEFNDVSITGNTDLETLTLDHTTRLTKTGTAATAVETGASLTVTGNSKLTTLVSSADHIDALTVHTNAKLASIDFTGLKDGGTSTTATVAIGGTAATKNNLTASLITDAYDSGTTDTGSFTSTSGMKTLKTYLDVVVAKPSSSGVKVYFDGADSHVVKGATTASDSETTSLVIGASSTVTAKLAVVNVEVSNAIAAPAAITAVRSFYIVNNHGGTMTLTAKNVAKTLVSGANAKVNAAAFVTDNSAAYLADGLTVTSAGAGAAVDGGSASSTFRVQADEADAMTIAYGESIKIGVGTTIVTIPISDTDSTADGVQISGVTVTFDVNSAVAGTQTSVDPSSSAYSATGSGTAYVTSMTQLNAALVAYLNEADWSAPDHDDRQDTTSGYDLGRWTASANSTTDLDLDISVDGVGTKALTGAITTEHVEATGATEITINSYDDNSTTAANTVEHAGVMLRFAATTAGAAYNFTISETGSTGTSATLIDNLVDRDGADGTMYAGAKSASAATYDNYRMDAAESAATTITYADDSTSVLEQKYAVDDYEAADYMYGVDAGDATASTAADTDRTGWL